MDKKPLSAYIQVIMRNISSVFLFVIISFHSSLALEKNQLISKDGFYQKTDDYLLNVKVFDIEFLRPTALVWLNNNELLVAEKSGKLWLVHLEDNKVVQKNQIKSSIEFSHLSNTGQGKIMDFEKHPNYLINGWIYVIYSAQDKTDSIQTTTVLSRFRLIRGSISNFEQLFEARPYLQSFKHYGSQITFDNKGAVLFSIGDRGIRDQAQNINSHAGSIIRINSDGTVPMDNPFLDSNEKQQQPINVDEKNQSRFIFSYGHRNPQGLVYYDGKLFEHEHGPRGGDEFNIIEKGKNYGWPKISYGLEYATGLPVGKAYAEGMQQPVFYWSPSIAPSGLFVYQGEAFEKWNNNLILASLKFGQVIRLELDNDYKLKKQEILLDGDFGRIRNVIQGPDDYLYFITDETKGKLVQIRPANPNLDSKNN